MASDPLAWPKLKDKLRKIVEKWADELPSNLDLHPEALFSAATEESLTTGPALTQLRDSLRMLIVPEAALWATAIKEHRISLRAGRALDGLPCVGR